MWVWVGLSRHRIGSRPAGCYEYGNRPSGSIKCEEICVQLSVSQLLEEDAATSSGLVSLSAEYVQRCQNEKLKYLNK
jgi:hypothetical protein